MPDQDFDLEEKLMQVAFSEVEETSLDIFQKLGRVFKDGEVLFREGERSTELVMIVRGTCKITKGQGADERVLAYLKGGEILGEMSHFDDSPRSASATAVGDLYVLWLTRETFGMVFELHHKWTIQLISALSKRISGTFNRLVAAHDRPPPEVPVPAPAPIQAAPPTRVLASVPTPVAPPPPAPPSAASPAAARPAVDDRLEKFYSGLKSVVAARHDVRERPGVLAALRQSAAGRAEGADQRRRVEELFAYAEGRLRREGILA